MIRAIIAVLFLLGPTPAIASVLWFSGVETSNLGEFASTDASGTNHNINCSTTGACSTASCADTTHDPHAGCYAVKLTGAVVNAGFVQSKAGLNKTTLYTRTYFKFLDIGARIINEPVYGAGSLAHGDQIVLMLKTDNTLFWCKNSADSTCTAVASGSTVLVADTWYLIETKMVVDASVGGMELKINGTVEFTSLSSDTSGGVAMDYILFGPYKSVANNTTFVYIFDDIIMSDSGYLGAGIAIARQGIAGTPTYDTWTKNSCSTIDECWSETPFSATKNASSATATNAQTMLLHSFGTTVTGHGSQAINPSNTVNACKTSLIAKSGTGGAGISIRRRIDGSDTDTAISLTTSDGYYEDSAFTTTATILNTSTNEAGALHGAGTATDTVEDVWLQCDFVPTNRVRHRVVQDD